MPSARKIVPALLALVLFAGFTALGTWQLARLQWKSALIERVDARVRQAPVDAPGLQQWAALTRPSHEYQRVRLAGQYLLHLSTPVMAVTELGPGFWVVTPLRRTDGTVVLVNRGYVPKFVPKFVPDAGDSAPVEVVGLLRITEPGGGFLRDNDPVNNKWYSRDVAAIANARGLSQVAPYFVDAAGSTPGGPVGGLTVVAFSNSHLVYALTWYALAAMVAGVYVWLRRGVNTRT